MTLSNPDARAIPRDHTELVKYIPEKFVNLFGTEVSIPSPEAKRLINRIFGKRISEWTGDDPSSVSLLQSIYNQSLDDGVAVERTFKDLKGREHVEDGHAILNRKAMLTELKERIGLKFIEEKQDYGYKKNFRILTLDLKNFREADLAGAGDYDLNIFTRQLNRAMEKVAESLDVNQEDLILGRYGGDEFYVGVIENTDKIEKIKKIIKTTVESEKGFFGNQEVENFKIKDGEVKEINIDGMDSASRIIFLHSLSNNLVLGTEELKKEVNFVNKDIQDLNILNMDKNKRHELLKFIAFTEESVYPEDINKITDPKAKLTKKIQFLIKGHDELRLPYILAEDLDAKENTTKRTEQLLHFYENYLIDPLLNEITMSRFDIFNHIKSGEFLNIYAYEVKMKEINDQLSYVYGDQTIKKLWNDEFKTKLRKAIKDGKVKVGRIGGLLVISQVKERGELDIETANLLKDPKSIVSKFGNDPINHEIGYAKIEVPNDVSDSTEVFNETVQKIFSEPTSDWLRKTFKRIIRNESEFNEFISLLKNQIPESVSNLTKISAKYFDSNRAAKRIPVAHEILEELRKDNIERVEEIYTLLTLIKGGFRSVWQIQ